MVSVVTSLPVDMLCRRLKQALSFFPGLPLEAFESWACFFCRYPLSFSGLEDRPFPIMKNTICAPPAPRRPVFFASPSQSVSAMSHSVRFFYGYQLASPVVAPSAFPSLTAGHSELCSPVSPKSILRPMLSPSPFFLFSRRMAFLNTASRSILVFAATPLCSDCAARNGQADTASRTPVAFCLRLAVPCRHIARHNRMPYHLRGVHLCICWSTLQRQGRLQFLAMEPLHI
ncbi:hypothetical protein TRVL_03838 [Trypanosoma vivax]|nr:hypothetical protein TRVL_03838 [Trypanosoma vivax]